MVNSAKMAEPIEMPFVSDSSGNYACDRGQINAIVRLADK